MVGETDGDSVEQLKRVAPAMYTDSTQAQPEKAPSPMLVTESGIVTLARLLQP